MTADYFQARIASDLNGLASVKLDAKKQSQKAVEEVATQFEALFFQMMLKSMRDASLGDSMFDSNQMQMYRDMYDKQLSMHLAERNTLGIADMLVRQLGKVDDAGESNELKSLPEINYSLPLPVRAEPENYQAQQQAPVEPDALKNIKFDGPEDFINKLRPIAEKYANQLGVNPSVLLAQAALETGWGNKIIPATKGGSSHNLFGIKADKNWQGQSSHVPTLEYKQDQFQRINADFRSYSSFEDSFSDYVDFIRSNQRYEEALKNVGNAEQYVHELQLAGYATDPEYANKIIQIMHEHEI